MSKSDPQEEFFNIPAVDGLTGLYGTISEFSGAEQELVYIMPVTKGNQ
jgi:hypothetical protein